MDRHINLLCDLSELNWVFGDATGVDSFLDKTVRMVARHMEADVCSIYLFDEARQQLVLRATLGLNPQLVGLVSLAPGEGLTGLAFREMRPICESNSSAHPAYRFFQGLFEEEFDAFLAVPLLRGIRKIGVIVVQRKGTEGFDKHDIDALRAVSGQLANAVAYAHAQLSTTRPSPVRNAPLPRFIKGKIAAPGFARAPLSLFDRRQIHDELRHCDWHERWEREHFDQAVTTTIAQLEEYQERLGRQLADIASLIFSAHLLMLRDTAFIGPITALIEQGVNPPSAILRVADDYIRSFAAHENPYMREKGDDIRDISIRLIRNLTGLHHDHGDLRETIVVARDLLPSDILVLSLQDVRGIVVTGGGVTSHLSVLARSLNLPMLIVDEPALLAAPAQTDALLDAETGTLFLNPGSDIVQTYEHRNRAREQAATANEHATGAATADGVPVRLQATINLLSDLEGATRLHAEGIGLYRTEFPFMIRSTFPTEEEQVSIYRRLIEGAPPGPVVFRTLDIGGDKELSYAENRLEPNPFLGLRSIRFTLHNRDIFKQQLRAMLRAAAGRDIGILFPMISSFDEYTTVRAVVAECCKELAADNLDHLATPRLGIMIELPAVVSIIESFAGHVDFFSLGTNDLIQYTLGVDRTNERVAHLYTPCHPAVLRSIDTVAQAASRHDIELSVCGDMANNEQMLPFLVGIGIRSLSVEPVYLSRVRHTLGSITSADARCVAAAALACTTIAAVREVLGCDKPF